MSSLVEKLMIFLARVNGRVNTQKMSCLKVNDGNLYLVNSVASSAHPIPDRQTRAHVRTCVHAHRHNRTHHLFTQTHNHFGFPSL